MINIFRRQFPARGVLFSLLVAMADFDYSYLIIKLPLCALLRI
jgi:hypothetical protein